MADEREVKLVVPDTFVLPDLGGSAPGGRAVDRGVHLLETTYWDTARMELYCAGFGLRHRTMDGERGTWTLKGWTRRDGRALVRQELEVQGGGDALPLDLAEQLPQRDGELRPVAVLRVDRHAVDLLDSAGTRWAEVADDRVAVLRGRQVVESFREVEVELTGKYDAAWLEAALQRLETAGARDGGGVAKHTRALEALGLLPERAPEPG